MVYQKNKIFLWKISADKKTLKIFQHFLILILEMKTKWDKFVMSSTGHFQSFPPTPRNLIWKKKSHQTTNKKNLAWATVLHRLLMHKYHNLIHCLKKIIWTSTRVNQSSESANKLGTDQPAHLCSLISTFVIRIL